MEANTQPKEYTYKELKEIAQQLSEQLAQARMEINKRDLTNTFKRLDYLFKVLDYKECFNSPFILQCANDIEEIMTLPKETEE